MLDFDSFIQTMEMSRIKTPATRLTLQLFLDFKFDLSRVACFRTASEGEQRLCLVRKQSCSNSKNSTVKQVHYNVQI